MNERFYRTAVLGLLVALCVLIGWCGLKLDGLRRVIPDERDLPSAHQVRDITKSLDAVRKDIATIKDNTEPPEMAALRRNLSRPLPAPTPQPIDPGRIIYPRGR